MKTVWQGAGSSRAAVSFCGLHSTVPKCAFANWMQTRFACDEGVYKAFLEILNMYRKGQKTINNVYELVRRQGFSAPA